LTMGLIISGASIVLLSGLCIVGMRNVTDKRR
jgi:hypothetical protein